MTDQGLDYSFTRPPIPAIVAGGYLFVCRYLSWVNPNTQGKLLTPPERDALLGAHVDIYLNWEYDAADELGGATAGQSQATEAVRQAKALGYPAGATIYFSGDINETPEQAVPVAAYFTAAAPIVHAAGYRVGAYGGYWYIKRLFDAQLVDDGWQTYAWSGGLWDARAAVRQVQNGISVGGQQADLDERVGVAYSWLHPAAGGDTMTPEQAFVQHVTNWRLECIGQMIDPIHWPDFTDATGKVWPGGSEPNLLAQAIVKAQGGTPSLAAHTHTGGTTGPAVAG